jgi:hypothetical protein
VPATGTVTTPPGAASYADGGAYLQCIGALHCWGQWTLYTGLGGNELTVPFSTVDGHDWTYETAPASVSTFLSLLHVDLGLCGGGSRHRRQHRRRAILVA